MSKKLLAVLLALTMPMSLTACSSDGAEAVEENDEIEEEVGGETEETKVDETVEAQKEGAVPAFPAEYDGCTLDITHIDTDEGYMTVYATFINDNEEPAYALSLFVVKAFQRGVELEDCSDINGDEESLIQEAKDGASIDVTYKFKLDSDSEDVEVMACEPTAEQKLLAENIYNLSENQ